MRAFSRPADRGAQCVRRQRRRGRCQGRLRRRRIFQAECMTARLRAHAKRHRTHAFAAGGGPPAPCPTLPPLFLAYDAADVLVDGDLDDVARILGRAAYVL